MSDLLVTTALTQIETAMRDALALGLQKRITQATPTTLAALASSARSHDELCYVTSKLLTYRFDRFSTATHDGNNVVRPADLPTAGRWLKTTSTVATGYARVVALYEGESTAEEILARFSVKPAIVIVWQGSTNDPRSQSPGALYDYRPKFAIWIVSSNLRAEHQASVGSQISAEATEDPGANRILGDVKKLLAGSTLSDQAGIKWVELGSEARRHSSLADRLMVFELRVEVRATLHIPDDDLVPFASVRAFDVQYQLADLHDATELDPDNCIVSGLTVPPGAGLTQSIAAGQAWVGGAAVTVGTPVAHAFGPSTDTYRDLSATGVWTFAAVPREATAPAVTTGCLRVGVTRSTATDVESDHYVAATIENLGQPDQVPPV